MYRAFMVLLLGFSCAGSALATQSASIIIPAGTHVRMYVEGDIDADAAEKPLKAGDLFDAKAASDVLINGVLVVRKDAAGQGTLVDVRGTNKHGLTMRIDWVLAVDGTKLRLQKQGLDAESDPWWLSDRLEAFGMAGVFRVVDAFATNNESVQPLTP